MGALFNTKAPRVEQPWLDTGSRCVRQPIRDTHLIEWYARRDEDPSTYAWFCDYQTDFSGPHTLVRGVNRDAATPVPEGLRRVTIPSGRFARFVAAGDPSQVIWGTWQHIKEWPGRSAGRYVADCERYARMRSRTTQFRPTWSSDCVASRRF